MAAALGSKYEFRPIKTKDFPFASEGCDFTDDTVMTVAVASAIVKSREEKRPFRGVLVEEMRTFGRRYPNRGYGARFDAWLRSNNPQPYNSFGNGSAMRVSPCGLVAVTLDEALALAKASAEVTHDHPEGVRGAQAVAAAIFLARFGCTKQEIRDYVGENFYDLGFALDEIRPSYRFDVTCQGSVPESIVCFLESDSFEDAVRNAVSLGGDADTGLKGWRKWPQFCEDIVAGCGIDEMLPAEFIEMAELFDHLRDLRFGSYERMGMCASIGSWPID